MFRHAWLLVVAAVLCAGCVPVTEPVGDIDKSEPDKALVGKWPVAKGRGLAGQFGYKSLTVDAPEVKGNPKGLMRAVTHQDNLDSELWFYVTIVGKHAYANVLSAPSNRDEMKYSKEGEFAKWQKEPNKRYFIFRYKIDGDKLTIDCGNDGAFVALMKDEKFKSEAEKYVEFYRTPAGWLAKYLDKTGPEKIFDGTNYLELTRAKK